MPTNTQITIATDFAADWIDAERSRLSVTYTGEVPAAYNDDGELAEDAGLVDWPSDEEISKAVGKPVRFADTGDSLLDAIFHA